MMLLTLRGTPVLFQGDEIGLPDTKITAEDVKDPVGARYWPHYPGRDPARTPMPWRNQPGGGFTVPGATPWLPLGDVDACNVELQRDDEESLLSLTRALLAFRRSTTAVQLGGYAGVPSPPGTWLYRRGDDVTVALNLSDAEAAIDGSNGKIAIGTDRTREGEVIVGRLELRPWEGVVLSAGPTTAAR
jgi:alpha-glucosidase